jgi:hypothetical protein
MKTGSILKGHRILMVCKADYLAEPVGNMSAPSTAGRLSGRCRYMKSRVQRRDNCVRA